MSPLVHLVIERSWIKRASPGRSLMLSLRFACCTTSLLTCPPGHLNTVLRFLLSFLLPQYHNFPVRSSTSNPPSSVSFLAWGLALRRSASASSGAVTGPMVCASPLPVSTVRVLFCLLLSTHGTHIKKAPSPSLLRRISSCLDLYPTTRATSWLLDRQWLTLRLM